MTIKCPACDLVLPDDDVQGQIHHMEDEHPQIIEQRLRFAGFEYKDGVWVDKLATQE